MLSLSALVWLSIMAAIVAFWWHSDFVKNLALTMADQHCKQLGLQLLDQTMVIKGILPIRDSAGSLCLRRIYRFEFTSTGEVRYRGTIIMSGRRRESIELEPHILPNEEREDRIH